MKLICFSNLNFINKYNLSYYSYSFEGKTGEVSFGDPGSFTQTTKLGTSYDGSVLYSEERIVEQIPAKMDEILSKASGKDNVLEEIMKVFLFFSFFFFFLLFLNQTKQKTQ